MAIDKAPRKRPLVLVVDDVAPVIRMMTLELNSQGFDVIGARVGDDTYRTIEKYRPDVAVMEVMLPGISGFEVMAHVKRRYDLPVVFVTTNDRQGDREHALELGVDDYIMKPFAPADLSARLHAVLRDPAVGPHRDQMRAGDVEIDLGRRIVRRAGREVQLTTNEWALLFALASHRPRTQPVSAKDLLTAVWGGDYAHETRYLEAWIRRLREKLEHDPQAPRLIVGDAERGYLLGRPHQDAKASA
jgi:two-component system KDP operon response regulator KdpE